ncbi:MAG: CoA ester lyase [Sphingomonas sp.]|nr:CoA ester lyase [Sphingomonas sp.]
MTDLHPMRSALYVPAANARAIEKAPNLATDAIIFDLEDAVAPAIKQTAREAAAKAVVESASFGRRLSMLRVNGLDTPWGAEDLALARTLPLDAVLVPKVAKPDDIWLLDAELAAAPARLGLWVMIETCLAIGNLQAIADCAARGRLRGLVMGTNDLAFELRARPGRDRAGLVPYLALAVVAARSRGLAILDGVCNDFTDLDLFRAEAEQGRALGFDGKTLIHPAQIDPCNAAFSPIPDEVAHAQNIVAAFDLPENADKSVLQVDGRMVERMHLVEAQTVLAMAAMPIIKKSGRSPKGPLRSRLA